MDVACPLLDRLEDDRVQEPDHRRLVGQLQEVLRHAQFGGDGGEVYPLQFFRHFLGRAGHRRIEPVHRLHKLQSRYHHPLDRHAEHPLHLIQGEQVGGIGYGHEQPTVLLPQRQEEVRPGERQRQPGQQGGIHLAVFDLRLEGEAEPVGDFFQFCIHGHGLSCNSLSRLNGWSIRTASPNFCFWASVTSAISWAPLMMRGVRTISRLVLVRSLCLVLKSQPMSGMSPRSGTLVTISWSWSWISPPITTVSLSFTTTEVFAERVVVTMSAACPRSPVTADISWLMSSLTYSPSLIWGVILSLMPTSWRVTDCWAMPPVTTLVEVMNGTFW